MQWNNILLTELIFTFIALMVLGFVKLPRFFRHKKLAHGFPWGYYPDAVPKADPGFFIEGKDFLYDIGSAFDGAQSFGSFGDFGEFSGFGELGEFGNSFFSGD